jgi:hypothetical protein
VKDAEIVRLKVACEERFKEAEELTAERDALKTWVNEIFEMLGGKGEFDGIFVRERIEKLYQKRDALLAEVDQHVGTIEVLDAELRRAKGLASRADGA